MVSLFHCYCYSFFCFQCQQPNNVPFSTTVLCLSIRELSDTQTQKPLLARNCVYVCVCVWKRECVCVCVCMSMVLKSSSWQRAFSKGLQKKGLNCKNRGTLRYQSIIVNILVWGGWDSRRQPLTNNVNQYYVVRDHLKCISILV
jgi:hypothetical protein